MKFDKETAIVCLICGVLLVLWYTYYPSFTFSKAKPLPGQTTVPPVRIVEKTVPETVKKAELSAKKSTNAVPSPAARVRHALKLSNPSVEYSFDNQGILSDITFSSARKSDGKSVITLSEIESFEPLSLSIPGYKITGAELKKKSGRQAKIIRFYSEIKGENTVTVTLDLTLSEKTPALKCVMGFASGKSVLLRQVIVWNGTMPPVTVFSGDKIYRDVHTAEYMKAGGKLISADPSSKPEKFAGKRTDDPVQWTAAANKYFAALLTAAKPFDGNILQQCAAVPAGAAESIYLPCQGGILRNVMTPAVYEFQFFAGKKEKAQLSDMPESASKIIHLAYWGWLEPLCGPMLGLLNFLKRMTGSYGLAIILLTIIVKLVLWPLIHRGNKSMRKLQKVQPMVKELKEKYKDNPQLFNQKMMELYKKEGVNPMGGCFPMLLQFPVFVALYSTLDSAVELRHQSFLWASDLTRPDVVGPLVFGIGIHPFMILSTLLMILQMKLTPQGGDPAQQKMMMFMPLIMLIFFYSFPSGLTLYWCVNNILSILQMKYTQYAAKREDAKAAV